MRICKAKYILLGLTLCCLLTIETDCVKICYTDFTDPASKAYRAEIVTEATVIKLSTPQENGLYNATVRVLKSRKIMKGKKLITKRQRRWKRFTVGPFGEPHANMSKCIGKIVAGNNYFFFLKVTKDTMFFRIMALSESANRRVKRAIKRIVCKNCVPIEPDIVRLRDVTVNAGKRFSVTCIVVGLPKPKITWFKDGHRLVKIRGIRVRYGRRGSVLRIRKAHRRMSGKYMCVAANLLQQTKKQMTLHVIKKRKIQSRKRNTLSTALPQKKVLSKRRNAQQRAKHKVEVEACIKQTYCLNGGRCTFAFASTWPHCLCLKEYQGVRCSILHAPTKLKHDRTLIVIGIVVAVFVFIVICIASYFLSRKKRIEFRRRQQQKRALSNSHWHNESQNHPLLMDEPDHGFPSRTGVFKLTTGTQTDESALIDYLAEKYGRSNILSLNDVTALLSDLQHNEQNSNSCNGNAVGRNRLFGVAGKTSNNSSDKIGVHKSAQNHTPHAPDIVVNSCESIDITSLSSSNYISHINKPHLPIDDRGSGDEELADDKPLYIDGSVSTCDLLFDDDSSIRETDILNDDEESDSDEENGRLVCEDADNGHVFYTELDLIDDSCPQTDETTEGDDDTLCNSDSNPIMKRDDYSDISLNMNESEEYPLYAVSDSSSFSDGSTPTGEVLDDFELDMEILDKYPEEMSINEQSVDPLSSRQVGYPKVKPYAAFPRSFNKDDVVISNPYVPDPPKHMVQRMTPNSIAHDTNNAIEMNEIPPAATECLVGDKESYS